MPSCGRWPLGCCGLLAYPACCGCFQLPGPESASASSAAFFSIELFAFFLLTPAQGRSLAQLWPLAFGLLWAAGLSCLLRLLPVAGARVGFGILYFLLLIYAAVQTGYYQLFSQMMWLSDFRYASEGSDYFDVLLSYPAAWWLGLLALAALGIAVLRRCKPATISCFPR